MRRRPTLLLLWSANGDPVEQFERVGLRGNAPFLIWDGLRYDRCPRQQESARIVHYQTRCILRRKRPRPTR
jgi:hypothetical protein